MNTKKIYLIRHGQTDYNLRGIVQGSGVDTSLNQVGRAQAEAFYQKYKQVPFKKIYTSALKRSIESVQKFIDSNIPWEKYAGLNEISWGEKDGKIVNSDDHNGYHDMLNEWNKGNLDMKIEGGESPVDVQKRMKPVIDIITSRPEEDLILICMHGRAMRIFLASVLNRDLVCMDDFPHQNLCLYILNYTSGKFEIEKFNDIEHL